MYARCIDMENREVIKIVLDGSDILAIGNNGLIKIKYHDPTGEGDRHYCDCYYDDGTAIRVFDIKHIYYSVEIKVNPIKNKDPWDE